MIKEGSIVKIFFEAYADGQLFDAKELQIKYKVDKINKKLEKALEDKKKGDYFKLEYNVVEAPPFYMPKSELFDEDFELQKGMELELSYLGKTKIVEVLDFDDENLLLKYKHPLEGRKIIFKIKVLDIL